MTGRIIELAAAFGRYGYRHITALLNREGRRVNHKRVERIWRQQALKVLKEQPKRGRLWLNDGSCIRLRPMHRDHVWAYDFVQDRTRDGRRIRMLTIVDEFTRECLAIDVGRSLKSDDVLERLAWLTPTRGVPEYIRPVNGAEFASKAVRQWLGNVGVQTLFIEPGSPWENECIESFNGKLGGRTAQTRVVRHAEGSQGADQGVAASLQSRSAALEPWGPASSPRNERCRAGLRSAQPVSAAAAYDVRLHW